MTWRFATRRLGRHPLAITVLALTLFGGVGLSLLSPLLIRQYIDQEMTRSAPPVASAAILVSGYLLVSLVVQLAAVGEAAVAERLARTVMDQVRVDVTQHCLTLGMDFHNATRPGDMVERIEGDVNLLANFLSRFVMMVVGQVLLLAGLIVALLLVDWRIGVSIGVLTVLVTLALRRLARLGRTSFNRFRQASAGLSGFLEEALTAAPDVQGVGGLAYTRQRLSGATREVFRAEQSAGIWGIIALWAAASFAAWSGTAVALLWSTHLYSVGAMTIGTVFLVFLYTQQMMQPLDQMAYQVQDYQAAASCVGRLQQLLDLPGTTPMGDRRPFPPGPVRIELRRMSFRYSPELPAALRDIDIVLPAGDTLGVVGRTGSGKSTLVRLLAALYAPTGGTILLNDVDIAAIDRPGIRERVVVIPQEVQLFKTTLRNNVTIFDQSRSDAEVRRAFEELGMSGWLERLPAGFDTVLVPGGSGLSAGEEQLVSFVRAFLSDPAVVLLDEASSRLDPATEQLVRQAMTKLLTGRTGVVVAHRLSTITEADWILLLEDGQVAEYGRRLDLVANPRSRFSRLLAHGVNDLEATPGGERSC
ncbi:MAG TPA: ABC transporter ATP-binding protein [Jatrophihabitans sp.]|jgi:ABC-type multidrug transport system fused ATPase/permease subunit|uniref:ABC transporter ATP-binding protein n=1 Tax=Jatrophihabitans sp. TaxID=1932789 RepID=UPI002F23B5F3